MTIAEIIAELTGLAQEQAGAARILETTRFEPELQAMTPRAIADARRKAEACAAAIALLNDKRTLDDLRFAEFQLLCERPLSNLAPAP